MATLKEKYKLPKRFKDKWVKALRSGKYKQGQKALKNNFDEYCCLGVAGLICGIDKTDLNLLGGFLHSSYTVPNLNKVPQAIKGDETNNELVQKLSNMNDTGKSFKYIASYIERYL